MHSKYASMTLKVIAYARNGHTDKFGIPRQSREESPILTRIVFEPEYNVREALRGIEEYSHLWLLWEFNASRPASPERPLQSGYRTANAVGPQDEPAVGLSWSPTVRPPRLGGNKRMGVFATRSPFRPNPIGLSSVRLVGVHTNEKSESGRIELVVSGADLLDGTPIYDIKPYLSFSDCHPDARNGFAETTKDYQAEVLIGDVPCTKELLEAEWGVPAQVAEDILYILRQDPRPGYQHDPERVYKTEYNGWRVAFSAGEKEGVTQVYLQGIDTV